MRIVSFLIVVLANISCKLDKEPIHNITEASSKDSLIINDTVTIQLNAEELQQKVKINPIKSDEDDSNFIKDYVVHKQLYKETDNYIIDFCYPQLDENYNPEI